MRGSPAQPLTAGASTGRAAGNSVCWQIPAQQNIKGDIWVEVIKLESGSGVILKINGIEYQREKMFPWMGKKRLDFFLPGKNIAIECQGVQHFYPYGSDDKDFEARKQRDTDKYNECTSKGVQVIYYMSDMIPLPDGMAGEYRYVTSLDELLGILNDK